MARVPRCHMVAQRSATAILGSFVATELNYLLSPLLVLQHACVSLEVAGWNSVLDLGLLSRYQSLHILVLLFR